MKNKLLRYRVIEKHVELVRHGQFKEAWCILDFLRRGYTTLGLSDVSCRVESILEKLGCYVWSERRGLYSKIYLRCAK